MILRTPLLFHFIFIFIFIFDYFPWRFCISSVLYLILSFPFSHPPHELLLFWTALQTPDSRLQTPDSHSYLSFPFFFFFPFSSFSLDFFFTYFFPFFPPLFFSASIIRSTL